MADDLAEALSAENTVVVVEWGDDIENILPKDCIKITIKINSDGTRELEL